MDSLPLGIGLDTQFIRRSIMARLRAREQVEMRKVLDLEPAYNLAKAMIQNKVTLIPSIHLLNNEVVVSEEVYNQAKGIFDKLTEEQT